MSPTIRDAKSVLVIGATAGIGRELARAIHGLPSQPTVIVTGRRMERLTELTHGRDRLEAMQLDVTAGDSALKDFVDGIIKRYPKVSCRATCRSVYMTVGLHAGS